MRRTLTRLIVVGATAVGVAGVSFAYPEWTADVGLDLWNLPAMNNQIERGTKLSEELDYQMRSVLNRLEVKQNVVDDLHEGRLTLREAAAQFRDLNAVNMKFVQMAQSNRPNCGEMECHYWNVIDCARNSFGRYPDEDQFVKRLTEELRKLKERGELN